MNIEFTATHELDITALLDFSLGRRVFVAVWYDQSENAPSMNFGQSFGIKQPYIVDDTGSLITTASGKPSIHFEPVFPGVNALGNRYLEVSNNPQLFNHSNFVAYFHLGDPTTVSLTSGQSSRGGVMCMGRHYFSLPRNLNVDAENNRAMALFHHWDVYGGLALHKNTNAMAFEGPGLNIMDVAGDHVVGWSHIQWTLGPLWKMHLYQLAPTSDTVVDHTISWQSRRPGEAYQIRPGVIRIGNRFVGGGFPDTLDRRGNPALIDFKMSELVMFPEFPYGDQTAQVTSRISYWRN